VIGERVRHARTYQGWSQTELARRAGTSQPKISQLESGTYASSELVDEVANVTQFARWWFDMGPLPDLPRGSLKFRKTASASHRDDDRVRAHVRQAVEVINGVDNGTTAPPVRIRPCDPADIDSIESVERIAEEMREILGVGPVDPIPNMVRAVERSGVVVIGSAIEIDRHDGASFWPDYPIGRPIICVSRGTPGDRQRFNVGHELGHLVLHQFRNVEPARAEQESHRFAGALLIPADAAIAELSMPVTLRSLAYAKSRWGISIRALIRRCLDLRIIDKHKRISLERQLSARGWTKNEPVEVGYEHPLLLQRLITASTTKKPHEATGLPLMACRELLA
jgi:Zn-dependent peptidase ImmA (M78 family)/transcriptional regulator with XRE-family HTH domain